ncbi:MAG: hypothetical protein ABIS45_10870 [Burkholderiales bacterium]
MRSITIPILWLYCAAAGAALTCDQLGNIALATEQLRNQAVPLQEIVAEANKLEIDGNLTTGDMLRVRKTVQETYDRTRTPLDIRKECKDVPVK